MGNLTFFGVVVNEGKHQHDLLAAVMTAGEGHLDVKAHSQVLLLCTASFIFTFVSMYAVFFPTRKIVCSVNNGVG